MIGNTIAGRCFVVGEDQFTGKRPLFPQVRTAHKFKYAAFAVGDVKGHPKSAYLAPQEGPQIEVLVPRTGGQGPGLLYQKLVEEDVNLGRAHQAGGERRGRGTHDVVTKVGIVGPHELVAEELSGVVGSKFLAHRTGLGLEMIDGASHALNPLAVEDAAQADDAVALERVDIFLFD